MRKCVLLLLIPALLGGCAAEDTFETVSDEWLMDAAAPVREVNLTLPEEAMVPAAQTDTGVLYHCDGYELMLQILPGGDLNATIRDLTGFDRDAASPVQTTPGDYKRFDLVWTCMGENAEQVGRAAVLDDGYHHYVLSVLADADSAGQYGDAWEAVFRSFTLI